MNVRNGVAILHLPVVGQHPVLALWVAGMGRPGAEQAAPPVRKLM